MKRVLVGSAVVLLAIALLVFAPFKDAKPDPATPTQGKAAVNAAQPATASVAPASSSATDALRGSKPTSPAREEVTPESMEAKARKFLAANRPNGDVGHDHFLKSMQQALDPTAEFQKKFPGDPFAQPMPKADEVAANQSINSAGAKLTAEEQSQLQSLIDGYGSKLRECSRDQHLATNMASCEAIANGDFRTKPNGSDPDMIFQAYVKETEGLFADSRDRNITEAPGSDFSHNRLIVLTRDRYPDYFAMRDRDVSLHAELQAALRSFFPRRR